jgi:hypothetical protein
MFTQKKEIISVKELFCNQIHCPEIETRKIQTNTVEIHSPSSPHISCAGFQSNGDFLIKSSTTLNEWSINPLIRSVNNNNNILIGNRIGQICYLYISLSNSTPHTLEPHTSLFLDIPLEFRPGTMVVCPIALWKSEVSPLFTTLIINPQTNYVYLSSPFAPGDMIGGTISYLAFRSSNLKSTNL